MCPGHRNIQWDAVLLCVPPLIFVGVGCFGWVARGSLAGGSHWRCEACSSVHVDVGFGGEAKPSSPALPPEQTLVRQQLVLRVLSASSGWSLLFALVPWPFPFCFRFFFLFFFVACGFVVCSFVLFVSLFFSLDLTVSYWIKCEIDRHGVRPRSGLYCSLVLFVCCLSV